MSALGPAPQHWQAEERAQPKCGGKIRFLAYQAMTLVYLNRRPRRIPGLFFLPLKQ